MKKLAIFLITLGIGQTALANYTESLFLCDLGILNPDGTRSHGIDSVEYTQYNRRRWLEATPQMSSAADLAASHGMNYDRWDPVNRMDDLSFNLQSDFYGSQYYMEYCYTWDRVAATPVDTLEYTISFRAGLPVTIPFTRLTVDTRCSSKFDSGAITNSQFLQTPLAQQTMGTHTVSARCTVRFSFNEQMGARRPHIDDLGAVDPQLTIKVDP